MPRFQRLTRFLVVALLVVVTFKVMGVFDYLSHKTLSGSFGLAQRPSKILRYVDPLIGTINGGHVFPGATLPYGMAKAVADTDSPGEDASGFASDDGAVIGFSHLHDSGTGGSPSLGNFPLFVHPGCIDDDPAKCKFSRVSRPVERVNGSVVARAGYFSIEMQNKVKAEMTTTLKTALYRFTVPKSEAHYVINGATYNVTANPLILLDVNDIATSRSEGSIKVDEEKLRMTGHGKFHPSFGLGDFEAFFCVDVRGADVKQSGTFQADVPDKDKKFIDTMPQSTGYPSGSVGAYFHLSHPKGEQILARVGLSFISTEQACGNAEREIPDFDFERVVSDAEDAWMDKLSVIELDTAGVSDDYQTTFWSGLYRSFLLPQNYTGENQLWESTEPYFDSFYCIWDSFRAQHPLLTVIDPHAQAEIVRALLDIYKHTGFLPDCRMSFSKGYTQGGSNADVVVADAFIKNITEGIDWDMAYEAVLADAENVPPDWRVEGRGDLESWRQFKYIAEDHKDPTGVALQTRTVSRTLEYAYDDYCISVIAQGLGFKDDAELYLERSGYWRNVWNPNQKDLFRDSYGETQESKYVGFPQPRLMDGRFKIQNPRACSPMYEMHRCYLDTYLSTYEGSPWLYSFYAPQDMAGLIEVFGGKDMFVERLDYFHSSGIAYMGNEPQFLTVFQFHYGGRPGKSSEWVHNYIPSQFNTSINGIPGNDDCAMGAFSSMAMMGFFPVAGQDVYLVTAPFFPEIRIQSRGDRPAVIRRLGDENGVYIQSAKLNGKPYNKNWITHDFFLNGGVLELVLGAEESRDWGTRDEDLPPSHPPTMKSEQDPVVSEEG